MIQHDVNKLENYFTTKLNAVKTLIWNNMWYNNVIYSLYRPKSLSI